VVSESEDMTSQAESAVEENQQLGSFSKGPQGVLKNKDPQGNKKKNHGSLGGRKSKDGHVVVGNCKESVPAEEAPAGEKKRKTTQGTEAHEDWSDATGVNNVEEYMKRPAKKPRVDGMDGA